MAQLTTQKQCVPDALAGAPGTSPEGEGADRPTPHPERVATPAACRNRQTCVLVWTDGMLQVPREHVKLSVLQFAVMTRALRTSPA